MEKKYAVLIVDDNVDLAGSLRDVLEVEGYDVTVAHNDQDALVICRQKNVDLALIDIKLPDTSGTELIHELANLYSDMEYIIITGYASLNSAVDAVKQKNVLSYESKPLDIERFLALIRQIFERKQTEEALQESEDRFRQFFDNNPSYCYMASPDGVLLDVNKAALKILSFEKKQLMGRSLQSIYAPESLPKMKQCFEKWKRTGVLRDEELTIITKNGDRRTVLLSAEDVKDKDGKLLHSVSVQTDITERKQLEEALRESEQNFRNSLDDSPLGIRIITADEELLYANQAILDIYGYSSVEELRAVPTKQRYTPESYIEHQERKEKRKQGEPVSSDYEIEIVRKDEKIRNLQVFRKQITWSGERRFQVIYNDITERKQAETKLKLFEEITSNMSEGVFLIQPGNGTIMYTNPRLNTMLGYETGELVGQKSSIMNAHTDRTSEEVAEGIREHLKTHKTWNGEVRHIKKDGTLCWSQVSSSMFEHHELGAVVVGIVSDITEHKIMEDALRESEENYRNSLDDSPLAIMVNKARGDIVYANQAAFDLFGYRDLEEMKNTPLTKRHTPENLVAIKERWEKIGRGEFVSEQYEHDIVRVNGEIRHVETFFKIILWDGEERLQITIQDITERKQAGKALQESERNFRASLDDSPLAIGINLGKGEVIYSNQTMLDLFGYRDLEEMKNTPLTKRHTPESLVAIKERWEKIEKGEYVSEKLEYDIIRVNGEIRHVEAFYKIILWDGEERLQITIQDITERKQMEDQLRHSQVLASLGEMTAGIAHEMGNPLASIVLYSEVAIKGHGVSGQTKKDLKIIQGEAKRAGHLMKDLLAYSRKLEPNMRRVNVHSVINKLVKMLQYQARVQNIKITTDFLKEVLNVNGDASQLTQVFMNLIMNAEEAVKGQGGGNITVKSGVEDGWVKVSVSDDGLGIPKENLDQIFLPFFTTKGIGEGTGLGLSTCYGIITNHGGVINAENNKDGGATFTVQLPLLGKGRQGVLPLETE